MTLADFEITVWLDPPRTVRVVVYDDLKGLRIAASRYDNRDRSRRRRQRGTFSETAGICHRFENYRADGTLHPLCAIVRLAKPHVGVGVLSHEMAHAAVWIHERNEPDAGPLTCENDEEFCWVLGELVSKAASVMIGLGVYDDDEDA